jgi:hypothetical protein
VAPILDFNYSHLQYEDKEFLADVEVQEQLIWLDVIEEIIFPPRACQLGLTNSIENMFMNTHGCQIKKYAQPTTSANVVSSLFTLYFYLFLIRIKNVWDIMNNIFSDCFLLVICFFYSRAHDIMHRKFVENSI